jgi:hypothetical protein
MLTATKVGVPAPGGTADLSPSELKYRLLDKYPNFFFCERDFFPLQRGDEQELALVRFPEIQKDTETYRSILKHTKLKGSLHHPATQLLMGASWRSCSRVMRWTARTY